MSQWFRDELESPTAISDLQDITMDSLTRNQHLLPGFPTTLTSYFPYSAMPRHQLRLSFPKVPTMQQHLLSAIQVDTLCTLPRAQNTFPGDFLLVCHDLLTSAVCFSCLHRPVHGTEHVTQDAWHIYHKNHQFLGPCCLCPLLQPLSQESRYTEAAIYLPLRGCYKGEWVAECAEGRCGYLGRSSSSPKPNCSYTPLFSPFREGVCQDRASSKEIRCQR